MEKKVAVLAVNPVNGFGLFQYLETFFENGISYDVYAVAESPKICTNSGMDIIVNDVVANLKGKEDQYDALVFACGDAIPVFAENTEKTYNQDLLAVIRTFGERKKIMIGHCAAAMLFELSGLPLEGKRVAVHPLAKPAVQKGVATDEKFEIDGNYYTAQSENWVWKMLDQVIQGLK